MEAANNHHKPKQQQANRLAWHLSPGVIKYCVPRITELRVGETKSEF